MKNKALLLSFLTLLSMSLFAQKQYTIQSPDQKITMTIRTGDRLSYSVTHENTVVLADSPIAMTLDNGTVLGVPAKVDFKESANVEERLKTPFYKKSQIRDSYNELVLYFQNNYSVSFRAYNEGVAYRFATEFKQPFHVVSETADFNFDEDYNAWIPYVNARPGEGDFIDQQFFNSFENTYTVTPLSKMEPDRLAFLPVLVALNDGKKAVITESDLEAFPGLYLRNEKGKTGFTAVHAGYPKVEEQGGHNNLQYVVKERENYIAQAEGTRHFPWRCIVISENDKDLADSDLVFQLASSCRVDNLSWIKPGKVAWDWWNAWNLFDVPFEAGINNDTYKFYIDFASKYGIEYVILDEGWAVNKQADLFQVVPEIDLKELVNYAARRGVGIVLWAGYAAIDKDMEQVCKYYSELGVLPLRTVTG